MRHAAWGHFDVAIRTWCLPEEQEQPPPEPQAGIDLEKATNGHDADSPPGPTLTVGDPVVWEYVVTNTGELRLIGIEVTDDQGVEVTCPANTLAPGEAMTSTASGVAAEGQYATWARRPPARREV